MPDREASPSTNKLQSWPELAVEVELEAPETSYETPRRSARVAAKFLVAFSQTRFGGLLGPRIWIGRTLDVSPTGLQIQTVFEPVRGERLEVELAFGDLLIPAMTSVVHVKPLEDGLYLAGLEFTEISEEDRRLLASLLS